MGCLLGMRLAYASRVPIDDIVCNAGSTPSKDVIEVNAEDIITTEWHHTLSGFNASDVADPIETWQKGPIIVYLAKVDDALTTSTTGLNWFKIYEDGLTSGVWALDKLIVNEGIVNFTIPKCIPNGQYLLRAEIITLNAPSSYPNAEFYMECAQINISGGGAAVPSTVSFPGAYKSSDADNTFDLSENPTSYPIPGPALFTCDGSSKQELKREENYHQPHATGDYSGHGAGHPHVTGMPGEFGPPPGAAISKAWPTPSDLSMRKRAFDKKPRQYSTITSHPPQATESYASNTLLGTGMPFISTAAGVFPPGGTGAVETAMGYHHHHSKHRPHHTGGFYGPKGTDAPPVMPTSMSMAAETSLYMRRNLRYRRDAPPMGFPFAKDGGTFPVPTGEGPFYHYAPQGPQGTGAPGM
ncbi:hypothetical protein B7494_g740 [Chlorociboria aeruginascens]|nr:hypothetical protein B7494_g740 [Chlorociboria aeruginascens]